MQDIINNEDLHLISTEEDVNKVVKFIESVFVIDKDSKKYNDNFTKLSEFLTKNSVVIGELEAEKLLDNSEKLRKSFYGMYLAQTLNYLSKFSNLTVLTDLYCIRNDYEIQSDSDALYEEKGKDLDLIKVYINEIIQYKLLNREEEIELVNSGEDGRMKLVEHNLRLGVSIAKKYRGQGVSFGDLIQAANEGIMTAARKFDVNKGYKFSTYATWWARQGVKREIANTSRNIRIPAEVHDNIAKIKRVIEQYLKENNGKMPTDEEICNLSNISLENLLIAKKHMNSTLSLSNPIKNNESNDAVLSDFIEDDSLQLESEIDNYFYEGFKKIFDDSALKEREKEIIKLRYGFYGTVYNYEQIGKIIKLSKERIRQIEKQAIRKLRFDQNIKVYAGSEMGFRFRRI